MTWCHTILGDLRLYGLGGLVISSSSSACVVAVIRSLLAWRPSWISSTSSKILSLLVFLAWSFLCDATKESSLLWRFKARPRLRFPALVSDEGDEGVAGALFPPCTLWCTCTFHAFFLLAFLKRLTTTLGLTYFRWSWFLYVVRIIIMVRITLLCTFVICRAHFVKVRHVNRLSPVQKTYHNNCTVMAYFYNCINMVFTSIGL